MYKNRHMRTNVQFVTKRAENIPTRCEETIRVWVFLYMYICACVCACKRVCKSCVHGFALSRIFQLLCTLSYLLTWTEYMRD